MARTVLKLASREFDGFERSFARQRETFRELYPEIEIELEFRELTAHHRRMLVEGGAALGEADLFLCVTDWLPEAIAGGQLEPLSSYLAGDPPEDWPEGWSPSMRGLQSDERGEIYGLPYHDGPEVFMYRADLFGDPGEQAAFLKRHGRELAPPETWDEFVEVAAFFTRPETGLWGACVAGLPDAHNNIYDFMIHLWSRGGTLLSPSGEPRFHEEPGREALQFLVDLVHRHQVVSPDCLGLDSVASGLYYAAGYAAMMWNWSGFAAVAEDPSVSRIVGKNVCTKMPRAACSNGRSVSLNIYWVLAITSGSKNKDAAYLFLKHVAGREMDKATSMLGGNGTRLSTWRDPEVVKVFPYYRIIEEVHRDVESPPKIATFSAIAESLNQMVDDALNLRSSAETALRRAEAEVRKILGS